MSNLEGIALCAGVIILCLIQRLSMTWRLRPSFDNWGHTFFVSAVRKQKTGPFRPINVDVVEGGAFNYPLLSHWLLSFLPEHVFKKYIKLVNPAIESLGLALYLAVSFSAGVEMKIVLAAGLLYVLTPMIFSKVAIGPSSNFTTRTYSEIAAGLLLLFAFLPVSVTPITLSFLMTILVAYIILSSKFGLQFVLLVVLPASIITFNLPLFFGILMSFALSILVSKGAAISIWQEQARHLIWYLGQVRANRIDIANRNGMAPFRKAFNAGGLKSKITHFCFALVAQNSFAGLVLKFPMVIAVLLIPWIYQEDVNITAIGFFSLLGVASFVYLIINTTVLIILGEAERYFNHFTFLILLVFTEWSFGIGEASWYWFAIIWGCLYWLAELLVFGLLGLNKPNYDEDAAFDKLTAIAPKGSVVLCYPYHVLPPWRLLATSTLRPIFPIIGAGAGRARLKEMESYPTIDLSHLEELKSDFSLSFVVAQDSKLDVDAMNQLAQNGWHSIEDAKAEGITIFKYQKDA